LLKIFIHTCLNIGSFFKKNSLLISTFLKKNHAQTLRDAISCIS